MYIRKFKINYNIIIRFFHVFVKKFPLCEQVRYGQ